jgi:hypothetical protein
MSILPQAIGTALAIGNSLQAGGGFGQAPGQGAGQFPVTLGTVTLQGFEVPDSAPWGGGQALTVHKLIGGARVIDAMGVDDRAMTIRGTFLSPDADDRALQVDVMRKAGLPVPFSWSNHVYLVVIKAFEPEYQRPDRVPYALTLEILQDSTQPPASPDPSDDDLFNASLASIGQSLSSLAANPLVAAVQVFQSASAAISSVTASIALATSFGPAAALGLPSALSGLQTSIGMVIGGVAAGIGGPVISAVNGALAIAGSVSTAAAADLAAIDTAIGQGQAILAPAIGFADGFLSNVANLGGIAIGAAPAVAAASLTTVTGLATALPMLQQIAANLTTMQQIASRTL